MIKSPSITRQSAYILSAALSYCKSLQQLNIPCTIYSTGSSYASSSSSFSLLFSSSLSCVETLLKVMKTIEPNLLLTDDSCTSSDSIVFETITHQLPSLPILLLNSRSVVPDIRRKNNWEKILLGRGTNQRHCYRDMFEDSFFPIFMLSLSLQEKEDEIGDEEKVKEDRYQTSVEDLMNDAHDAIVMEKESLLESGIDMKSIAQAVKLYFDGNTSSSSRSKEWSESMALLSLQQLEQQSDHKNEALTMLSRLLAAVDAGLLSSQRLLTANLSLSNMHTLKRLIAIKEFGLLVSLHLLPPLSSPDIFAFNALLPDLTISSSSLSRKLTLMKPLFPLAISTADTDDPVFNHLQFALVEHGFLPILDSEEALDYYARFHLTHAVSPRDGLKHALHELAVHSLIPWQLHPGLVIQATLIAADLMTAGLQLPKREIESTCAARTSLPADIIVTR